MLKTISITLVEEPQMSAKTLCEYADASVLLRTSIIKDCKYKKSFITNRYNDAEDAICECFQYTFEYLEVLVDGAKNLRKKGNFLTDKKQEHAFSSADALEALYRMERDLQILSKFVIRTENKKSRKMIINGVTVSIRPELSLSLDSGMATCGFVKFYIGKSKPLSESIALNMACLGKQYFKDVEKLDFTPAYCFVVDVFAGKIYNAPVSYKRTLSILNACCVEIRDRWDKIIDPNYD